LWPEHGGGAVRPQQRVGDIAGDDEVGLEGVRRSRERLEESATAIRGGAAPDPEDDPAVAASSSPVPMLVAVIGSRSSLATRERPEASAISMTAVGVPSTVALSQRAVTGRPSGSWTTVVRQSQPPAAATASSVPSPPSASGHRRISSSGRARSQPSASARATCTDVSVPLNESGANRTIMRSAAGLDPVVRASFAHTPVVTSLARDRVGTRQTPERGASPRSCQTPVRDAGGSNVRRDAR
jgi:hypothetical protein